MTIDIYSQNQDKTLLLQIKGSFDFSQVNDFRRAYEDKPDYRHYVIDFGQADAIDSSTLGMLLNMERFFAGRPVKIELINCNRTICRVFEIAHFNKKFSIECQGNFA